MCLNLKQVSFVRNSILITYVFMFINVYPKTNSDIDFSNDVVKQLNLNMDVDELYNENERLEETKKKED